MPDKGMNRREWMKTAALAGGAMGVAGSAAARDRVANERLAQADAPVKMPTKQLGTTGVEIPILVMGCGQTFDQTYDRVLHQAFKEGVTYLDTAQQYDGGNSHKAVGVFQEQVGRKNVFITSKVPMQGAASTTQHYVSNLEKMMPELRTDYLDMFFMHGLNNPDMLEPEFIQMADSLKKRGLIKFFGFSCHHGNVVELMEKAAKIGAPGVDAIMFRYSFASFGDAELNRAIDNCKKAGIGLIAMKTQRSVPAEKEDVVEFQSKNFTLPQAKLKSVWADDRLDAAISEMTNFAQIEENTAAARSTEKLAMEEFVQLNRLAALTAPYACMGCNHICESRVEGEVRIADTLRYLMYDDSYGNRKVAKRLYDELTPAQRAHAGVDFSAAERACPQHIRIAERLAEAHRRLA